MVLVAGRPYARDMELIPPQEQAPPAETDQELTETEAAEIEERLRWLGYVD
jgi:hypothetical protein